MKGATVMESTVVALLNSWQETDYILYKASFLGLTESEVSILTPKTAAGGGDQQLATPGARYLGMTEGVPLKMDGQHFTAYGDWSLVPLFPGRQSGFESLAASFKSLGINSVIAGRLVHGLKKGGTLLFVASYTKDMVGKLKTLLKDTLVFEGNPSSMHEQIEIFREHGCL
jgi:hypothetical protein